MIHCFAHKNSLVILVFLLSFSSVIFSAMSQSFANADSTTASPSDSISLPDPTGAMLRSLILPGWGQFYNGKWFKGILIGGAEIGFLTNAIVLNQYLQSAETEIDRNYYWENRNLSIWLLGATILYSMADAYVDAHMADFEASPDLSMVTFTQSEPKTGLTSRFYTIQFTFNW